jgi:hypothetical protein
MVTVLGGAGKGSAGCQQGQAQDGGGDTLHGNSSVRGGSAADESMLGKIP